MSGGAIEGGCFFEEKVATIMAAGGYEAVIIMNREGPDACKSVFEPFLEDETLPVIFIGRDAGFALFDREADFDLDECLAGAEGDFWDLPVGTVGDTVTGVTSEFDGWGYVRLFDAETYEELDQYVDHRLPCRVRRGRSITTADGQSGWDGRRPSPSESLPSRTPPAPAPSMVSA